MSGRSRDQSSSGDWSLFPWLSDDCGYGHYLSAADDGTWRQLLKRGAHGQGLLVSHLQSDFCCAGRSPRGATSDDGIPWLLPALVRWDSPLDEEHMLTSSLATLLDDGEHEEFAHPPIIISDCLFLDAQSGLETMPLVNLSWGQMAHEEPQYLTDYGRFEGLAYPWQIVPLTKQAHDEILITMNAAMTSFQTWVFSEANCWIAMYEDDDDDEHDPDLADDLPERDQPGVYEGHGCHECGHRLGEPKCDCGRWATKEQIYLSLLNSDLTGKDFLPERYHPLWDYALTRYAVGWQTIAASMEQGDEWSTSCWSQHSPFSDGSSPAALLQALSQGSTPSPSSSGSSAA